MKKIEIFNHNNKLIYSSDRQVFAIYPNRYSKKYVDLDISKLFISNPEKFWSIKTYNFFKSMNLIINDLDSLEREYKAFEQQYKNTVVYNQIAPNTLKEIEFKDNKIVSDIEGFFQQYGFKIEDLTEKNDEKKKIKKIYRRYIKNNIWFEMLCYALFEKIKLKNKYLVFQVDIMGKEGLKHEIDIAMITPLHITLIECKSSKYKKGELMELIGKKSDIGADIAFFITGDENTDGKVIDDRYRNVFVIDKAFSKKFDELFNKIVSIY